MNKTEHFSLADWDYDVPGPYISDVVYVSAPSSLAARLEGTFNRQGWAMCNLASAANVFDGRIVTYLRGATVTYSFVQKYYRAQANPTAPATNPRDCYWISITYNMVTLRKVVGGSVAVLASANLDPVLLVNTWYHFRTTWWQYLQPDMTKLLRHTVEQYKDGAWTEVFQWDDSLNLWAGSAVNKIGFLLLHRNNIKPTAIDNTEIWKRLT